MKDEVMKIKVLPTLVTIVGISAMTMLAFGGQTDKPPANSPISQPAQTANNLNLEESAIDDSKTTWGMHEPLKSCTPCHGDESKQASPEQPHLVTPVPELCSICHKEYAAMEGWVHGPVATGNCMLCHEPHQTENQSLLNKTIPELCYRCHETKILQLVPGHSEKSYASCSSCHDSHSSPGRMLLKQAFLNTDAGLAYVGRNPSVQPRPSYVDRRDSLVGLKGIEVVPILDRPDLFANYGLTEDFIKAEVESQLQRNGIDLIQHNEQTTRQTSLCVQLRLMEMPSLRDSSLIYGLSGSFNLSLQQTVELLPTLADSRRRVCTATTWDTGAIFIWGTSGAKEGLREAVKVLIGQFSQDYLKANPKEQTLMPLSGER